MDHSFLYIYIQFVFVQHDVYQLAILIVTCAFGLSKQQVVVTCWNPTYAEIRTGSCQSKTRKGQNP